MGKIARKTYAKGNVVGVKDYETANLQRLVADQVYAVPSKRRVSDAACGVVDGDDGMTVGVDKGEFRLICGVLADVVDVAKVGGVYSALVVAKSCKARRRA